MLLNPVPLLRRKLAQLTSIERRIQRLQEAVGRIEGRQLAALDAGDLETNEFSVYSQWGEDGIIQHLLRHVAVERKLFVEFGVGDYRESNTRFLLRKDHWAGLVMEGSRRNVLAIRRDPSYWKWNLKAVQAFVTRENINGLLRDNGVAGRIGLLSIDVDGNDYWVWEAIDAVAPDLVIVEYNSLFGPRAQVSIPYDPRFTRGGAGRTNLYFGASLAALCELGRKKGYGFVGSNAGACNAFFVRDGLGDSLRRLSAAEGYRQTAARESRDARGEMTYLDFAAAQREIGPLPVHDLRSGGIVTAGAALERAERGD